MGIVRELSPTSSKLSAQRIVQRILRNETEHRQRFAKKNVAEQQYYADRYATRSAHDN